MVDETRVYETEAQATRERIAAAIDDLTTRLSPQTLVNNAVDSISATGNDALASVRTALAGHPLVLGAVGLAVGISLLARNRVKGAKVEYGDSYAAYADYDDGYAADLAGREPHVGARERLGDLQYRAHVAVDDSPLAVVAVGVATGALLGVVIPVSAKENALFGDARDRLVAAGRAAVDAARDEFDVPKLLFGGDIAAIPDRASVAMENIAQAAIGELSRPNA